MADIAFLRVHAWFDQAITEALKDVAHPNQKTALGRKILWSLTDPNNPGVAPPPADPAQFAKSLSVGVLVKRRFSYARTWPWACREKRVGSSEASSSLHFNIAVQSGAY